MLSPNIILVIFITILKYTECIFCCKVGLYFSVRFSLKMIVLQENIHMGNHLGHGKVIFLPLEYQLNFRASTREGENEQECLPLSTRGVCLLCPLILISGKRKMGNVF